MPSAPGARTLATLLLALVPVVALLHAMWRDAVNVPIVDEWGFAYEVVRAHDGALGAADLWAQNNEHRVPVAKGVLHLLARATRWDARAGVAANAVVGVTAVATAAWLVARSVGPVTPAVAGVLVVVASAVQCSLAQWQNWTWGWQLSLLLAELSGLGVAASALWIAMATARPRAWSAALVAIAVAGALSNGSGLALLGLAPAALLVALRLAGRPWRAGVAVALLVCAAVGGAYALGWRPPLGQPPRTPVRGHVGELAAYALALLGGPIASWDLATARAWGIVGVGLLAGSVAYVWLRAPAQRGAVLPWAVLGAYAASDAMLTATGRLAAGAHTALLSRYATFAVPLWLAVGPAVALALTTVRPRGLRAALSAAAGVALAVAAWQGARTWAIGDLRMAERATTAREVAACIAEPATAPDRCYLLLCWDADFARRIAVDLQARGLGPWAEGR